LLHTLHDSKPQQCQTGIYANDCSVSMINVTKCGVDTPTAPPAWMYFSGSMTDDCGPLYTVASFAGIKQDSTLPFPCDTMGAVGPNHFMVLLNGAAA